MPCFCARPGPIIDEITGETVCAKCGVVITSDMPSSRRSVKEVAGGAVRHAASSTAPTNTSRKMRRADAMVLGKVRSHEQIGYLIRTICAKLGLPHNASDDAVAIVLKHRQVFTYRNHSAGAAAAIYMSCRCAGIARSMNEISTAANANAKGCRKAYGKLCTVMENVEPPSAVGFVTRLASDLGLPEAVSRRALKLLDGCDKLGFVAGRSPTLLAAYVVYDESRDMDKSPTQSEVARAAGVSTVGLRNLVISHKAALKLAKQRARKKPSVNTP